MNREQIIRMALEALEFDGFTPEDLTHRSLHAKASTTLRTAIEQAEKQEPVAWMCHPFGDTEVEFSPHQECENCTPLYTTPPAAQAAPVKVWEAEGYDALMKEMQVVKARNIRQHAEIERLSALVRAQQITIDKLEQPEHDHMEDNLAMVAAPVQDECVVCGDKVRVIPRPWVGLTDEEIMKLLVPLYSDPSLVPWAIEVSMDEYRAIEAKLREKNGGQA